MRRVVSLVFIVASLVYIKRVCAYKVDFLGVTDDGDYPSTVEKGRLGRGTGRVASIASSIYLWEDKVLSGYPNYLHNTEIYWRLNEGSILLDHFYFEDRLYMFFFVSYPRDEFWDFSVRLVGTLYLMATHPMTPSTYKPMVARTRIILDGVAMDPMLPQSYLVYYPRKQDDLRRIVISVPDTRWLIFSLDDFSKIADIESNMYLVEFQFLSYSPNLYTKASYGNAELLKSMGVSCFFGDAALMKVPLGSKGRSVSAVSFNNGTILWNSDTHHENLVYCDGKTAVVAGDITDDVGNEEVVMIDLATGKTSAHKAPTRTRTSSYDPVSGLVFSVRRHSGLSFRTSLIAWRLADRHIMWSSEDVCDIHSRCFVLPMVADAIDVKISQVVAFSGNMIHGLDIETGKPFLAEKLINDEKFQKATVLHSAFGVVPEKNHQMIGLLCATLDEQSSFDGCFLVVYDTIKRSVIYKESGNPDGSMAMHIDAAEIFLDSPAGVYVSMVTESGEASSKPSRIRVTFYPGGVHSSPEKVRNMIFTTHGFGTYYSPMIMVPTFTDPLNSAILAPIMSRSGELIQVNIYNTKHNYHSRELPAMAHWDIMDASLVPLPNGDVVQVLEFGVVAIRCKDTGKRKYLETRVGRLLSYSTSRHENGGVLLALLNGIKLSVVRVVEDTKGMGDWAMQQVWEGDVPDTHKIYDSYQSVRILEDEDNMDRADIVSLARAYNMAFVLVRYKYDNVDGVQVLYEKAIEKSGSPYGAYRIALSEPASDRGRYVALATILSFDEDTSDVVVFDEKLNVVWNQTIAEHIPTYEKLPKAMHVSSIADYVVFSTCIGFVVFDLLDGKLLLDVGSDYEHSGNVHYSLVGVPYIIKQEYPIAIWMQQQGSDWEYVSYNLATHMFVGNSSTVQGLSSILQSVYSSLPVDTALMKIEAVQLDHSLERMEPGFMVVPGFGNVVVLGCSRSAGYFTELIASEPRLLEHKRNNDGICVPCKAGTYSDQNICIRCPYGYIAPEDGMYLCEACPAGTYSDELYATSCKKCPEGTTTIMEGQQWCDQCVDDPCGIGQCYIDHVTFEKKCNCFGLPYFDEHCFYPMYPAYLSPLALLLVAMLGLCCYLHRRTTKYKAVFRARVPRLKLEEEQRRSNYDWEIDLSDAHTVAEIATGATATIYLVVLPSGVWAAAKVFHEVDGSSIEFRTETEILAKLRHPNIVEYFGACARPTAIILEFAKMGSLGDYLKEKPLNVSTIHSFALQIASGLAYLHENDIIHRDLKSANVLLSSETLVKVTDFGISRSIGGEMTALAGTARWMAPEQICENSYERIEYDNKVDVYAFGLLIWEMFTRDIPYGDIRWDNEVMKNIVDGIHPILPDTIPGFYKSLMERCWQMDPKLRPSFPELIQEFRSHKPAGLT